ncbi:hypothetical protein ACFL6Q_03290 [Candidatus Neomarinimicrobiota bacterium]
MRSPFYLILGLSLPLFVIAQDKYAGELFEFPGDARSVAMGGTGVSSTHEAATGFFNPALLEHALEPSLMLAHREQFGGIVDANLMAISFQRTGELAFHLGVVQRGVDDIPDTRHALEDRNGNGKLDEDERLIPEDIDFFNQREWGILLSVARRDQIGWRWGGNVKLIGNSLAGELGLGLGFDLGMWRNLGQKMSLGFLLQDITTTQIYWSTGRWATTAPRISSGMSLDITLPVIEKSLIVEGEVTSRLDGRRLEESFHLWNASFICHTGAELILNNNLRLRAGSSTLYPFTLGVGLRFTTFKLDYAYIGDTRSQVFEPTHQVSLILFLEAIQAFLNS